MLPSRFNIFFLLNSNYVLVINNRAQSGRIGSERVRAKNSPTNLSLDIDNFTREAGNNFLADNGDSPTGNDITSQHLDLSIAKSPQSTSPGSSSVSEV